MYQPRRLNKTAAWRRPRRQPPRKSQPRPRRRRKQRARALRPTVDAKPLGPTVAVPTVPMMAGQLLRSPPPSTQPPSHRRRRSGARPGRKKQRRPAAAAAAAAGGVPSRLYGERTIASWLKETVRLASHQADWLSPPPHDDAGSAYHVRAS
jgi:hypothetical protein